MSIKTYFFVVLAGLILLTLAFFTGRLTKPNPPKPKPDIHIEYIPGDTIFVEKPSPVTIDYNEKPTQLMKDSIAIANFDSTYTDSVGNEINSKNTVQYNLKQNKFKLNERIEVKGYEKIIRDTIKITETKIETVEVKTDPPFYNTFVFGVISTAVVFLLTIFGLNL